MVKKALVFAGILSVPAFFMAVVGVFHFHFGITVLYTVTAALVLLETAAGVPTLKHGNYESAIVRPTAALIVAYMPNEQGIIFETLRHFASLGEFEQIVVAYNSPEVLEVEKFLGLVGGVDIVRVPESTSKAENINYVLDRGLLRTQNVAIFDTDHQPEPGSVQQAAYWFNTGYGAVQGRCLVRNQKRVSISGIAGAEFDGIYRLLHNARYNLTDMGIFGGSNCYWSVAILSQFRLRSVLTEDIDLSLRAICAGTAIAYDPNIVSTEEAPTTLVALWKQRVRWAMGWCQCTLWHTLPLLRAPHLSWQQKVYWLYNLPYREAFTVLSFSVYYVLVGYWFVEADIDDTWHRIFVATTGFGLLAIAASAEIIRNAGRTRDYRPNWILFALGLIPYAAFKSLVSVQSWTRLILRDYRWQCTERAG